MEFKISKILSEFVCLFISKTAKTTKSGGYNFVLGTKLDVYASFLYKKIHLRGPRALSTATNVYIVINLCFKGKLNCHPAFVSS